jgi:hypothetical protein
MKINRYRLFWGLLVFGFGVGSIPIANGNLYDQLAVVIITASGALAISLSFSEEDKK